MKFKIATALTYLVKNSLNALNSKGTALPGKILTKFYPNFLADSEKFINGAKFSVTGTNGKSTTSSILALILEKSGRVVIHNTEGANMPAGIATTVALGLNKTGMADNLVIETDEAYLAQIFKKINFDYLIATNLFEDQLDRHGSPIQLRGKIQEGINLNPNLKLILNADDPILEGFLGEKIYFGLNSVEYCTKKIESALEGNCDCPKCGKKLHYDKVFYSKVGAYSCSCGLLRPELNYSGDVKIFDDYFELKVSNEGKVYNFKVNLKGLFNAYNALGAVVGALIAGVNEVQIQAALNEFKPLYGRAYTTKVMGKNIKLNLIKNSVGASETIKSFGKLENAKILIAINNEYPDGRDFSWIYSTSFELLNSPTNSFFLSGTKANEMAQLLFRLGIDQKNIKIEPNLKTCVELGINSLEDGEELTALLVFTALAEFEKRM